MSQYKAKILLVGLLIDVYFKDIHPHIRSLWRGCPEVKGFILLGPDISVKHELVDQLNKVNLPFIIGGAAKYLPDCNNFKIKSNNIYLHSYGNKTLPINVCYNVTTDIFKYTTNLIDLPFYFRWFDYSDTNFEISGDYYDFSERSLKESLSYLSVGSTITITATTNSSAFRSINNEVFLKSFTYSNNIGPYVRFIQHIITNPNNNLFAINANSEVKIFKTNIDHIKDLSNLGIVAWWQEELLNFIYFFKNTTNNIHNKNINEFSHFISYNFGDKLSITSWILHFQNVQRYKELLLFSYINENNGLKVRELINDGVNIHAKSISGVTPICAAAYLNNTEMTQLLYYSGAIINSKDDYRSSPLIAAVTNNALSTAEFLLKSGADSNVYDNNKNTLLLIASSKGYANMSGLLLKFFADVNAENAQRQTALTVASSLGHTQIVEQLLERDVDLYHKDGDFHTSFFLALHNDHIDTAQLFCPRINSNFMCTKNDLVEQVLKDGYDPFETLTTMYNIWSLLNEKQQDIASAVIKCIQALDPQICYPDLLGLCHIKDSAASDQVLEEL